MNYYKIKQKPDITKYKPRLFSIKLSRQNYISINNKRSKNPNNRGKRKKVQKYS